MTDNLPAKRERGRPIGTTLMDTKGLELLAAIRGGRRPATARMLVGINRSTVARWLARGEDAALLEMHGTPLTPDEQKYRDFLRRYQRACVDMQAKLEKRLADLVPNMEPRDALEVLARMDREVWGRHDTLTVKDGGSDQDVLARWAETIGHVMKRVLEAAHLDDEQAERAQQALVEALAEVSVDDDDEGMAGVAV